eukprot:GFUD01123679.1.p2 GENE.GFUD01123679.1~~GFUD01123679.1.p2  ORF type:complete len:129 (+),score=37.23 GFUD01123679.1:444-830(+)
MASLLKFSTLRAKYSGLADFVTSYIAEAHPKERPNFSGNIDIGTHEVLEDRIEAARILQENIGSEDNTILVDTMDNLASQAYSAQPERLYVVLDGKVVLEGKSGPFGYNLAEIDTFLNNFATNLNQLV